MKLKKLEILGFKSFKDKVSFNFSDGISGIIGPNGCGKSNIVDALRWIMGEQNARLLRGKKMEDVIFGGSEIAAPVNMAEVTIILSNDGINFPAEYAEFSEVMVSRKVFRDGESEYAINKVPCRLLDIREFFMDTGIGARTYSLVEQNSVVGFAEAKPEERRQFIEEAAGITKYKNRKEAAYRKMESTKQNIVRLNDIIREVKIQLNSVSRQAKKAEKYKSVRNQIKEAETALSLENFAGLLAVRDALKEKWDALNAEETGNRTRLVQVEASIEEAKADLLAHEETRLQENLYRLKNEIDRKEQEITFARKKIADLADKKEKNSAETEILRKRSNDLGAEIESLKSLLSESAASADRLKNEIAGNQKMVDSERLLEKNTRKNFDEKKNLQFSMASDHARIKNTCFGLEKGIEDLGRRKERENREIEGNNIRLGSVEKNLDALNSDLLADFDQLEMAEEKERVIRQELDDAKSKLKSADLRIASLKESLGKKSARLSSLREFQESYEWCNEGAKSILRANAESGLTGSGIYGLVADHIDVPREYETAVEAVLGEKLQYLVVHKAEDAIKAIDYLKSSSSGRGSFVPLEVRNNTNGLDSIAHQQDIVKLIDVIRVGDEFKSIADYLLGDVFLISNLDNGIALWRRNGFSGTMVTPEGDMISPHGVLTGGNGGSAESSNLLRSKREISELRVEIEELSTALREAMAKKNAFETGIGDWEGELRDIQSELRQFEISVNSKKKDIERVENEAKWVEQSLNSLLFNRDNLVAEETETSRKLNSLKGELLENERLGKEIAEQVTSLSRMWDESRSRLESLEKNLTEQRVLFASLDEKCNAITRSLSRLDADVTSAADEIALRNTDSEMCDQASSELAARILSDEEMLRNHYSEYAKVETDLAREKEMKAAGESRLSELETQARGIKMKLEEILRHNNENQMESHKILLSLEALRKDIQEKYFIDLAALVPEFKRLGEQEQEELTRKLEANRMTVEEFGEVNLLAIEEHENLNKRYDFLTAQVTDLNVSLDALQRTIFRINRISRTRFAETFEAVNQCFQSAFPKLFPNGRGELHLTESEDLLEAGIDVHVQIPGKKTQNISLLSGGEKSLVAVALIFAIILYRPTPFLILDEVDAALDDQNISLFNGFIRDISQSSQIILVTHNKRTMEIADNLFGITMEKQGVSTMVSVNLNG